MCTTLHVLGLSMVLGAGLLMVSSLHEDGPNVCTRKESYFDQVQVSYSKPYQVRTFTWCLAIPPRCSKYRIMYTTGYKTEPKESTRTVNECCTGFFEIPKLSTCMPCPSDKWGKNCGQDCKCRNGASCDPVNGMCACEAGWRGELCELKCEGGKFGDACAQDCRCQNGATCNHISGTCHCAPGYIGPLCSKECSEGSFGNQCSKTCGCQNGGKCHHVSGNCSCSHGWTGDVCGNQCLSGFYGKGCDEECTCSGASCHHVTGQCVCGIPGPRPQPQ